MRTDILHKRTDILHKHSLYRLEIWKLVLAVATGSATIFGLIGGLLGYILR